ncbi:hypothetical protein [Paraburkholderia sp. A3RO-2L]|jgi:hypothetical protein|uniref:hypothetical protein n=1 Tax=unclassified Paraburkholderia TaxID=2615204 RepID=UPI0032FF4979|nr:hypothetical protein [Burkholderia vietnamiensis]
MQLNLYTVKHWSSLDWKWLEFDALAQTEAQVREQVDKTCSSEYRLRPYVPEDQRTDTLVIECHGPVALPYVLESR